MFVDHVNNARRHDERNNSKDDGEGLTGPTDGLIQRPLLIQEAKDYRTPMRTFERLRRHETVRPHLGALVYFTPVLRYKCNLLIIGNNA